MQDDTGGNESGSSDTAQEVRKAFAELPFEKKLTTLFRIELDLVGDVAEGIASGVESVAKDVARWFACDSAAQPTENEPRPS